jgi:hypothetical protein
MGYLVAFAVLGVAATLTFAGAIRGVGPAWP